MIIKKKHSSTKIEYYLYDNNGSTMVETLVSFVILVILLLVICRMVMFCNGLKLKAIATDKAISDFNSEIYKKDPEASGKVDKYNYTIISETKGPVFYLELDDESTDMTNNMIDTTSYNNFKIRMNETEADSFVYKNTETDIITPKVIHFYLK